MLRNPRFECQYRCSLGVAIFNAGEIQNPGDMCNILLTNCDEFFGVFKVIVTIRQSQTTDRQVELMAVCIGAVSAYIKAKRAGGIVNLSSTEGGDELFASLNLIERGQTRQQGTDPQLIQGFDIHVAFIIVADLLLDRADGRLPGGKIVDNCANTLIGSVTKYRKRPIVAAAGRQLKAFQPFAIGVAEKVIPGANVRILMAQVYAKAAKFGSGILGLAVRVGALSRNSCDLRTGLLGGCVFRAAGNQ